MLKNISFLLLVLMVSCTGHNPPPDVVKTKSHTKHKPVAPKSSPGPWIIKTYTDGNGEPTARKYITVDADGNFSNPTVSDGYLNAVILLDKSNAGILLHKFKKSSPAEKFPGVVHIKMKNSAGKELAMTSSRGWNNSIGILIEKNNNDYSQFRIFMLQSDGVINVEIHDDSSSVYNFDINSSGFSDAFNQI